MRTTSLVTVAFLAIAAPASGQPSAEGAIRAALDKYVKAFNAGDADAAAATYTPEASHTYALGYTHHGRAEIAQGLRELFAGPLKGARLSIASLKVRLLTPDIAVEEESFSLIGLRSADGQAQPDVNGLCLAVYQRQGAEWFAAAVQCLLPPAGPPPK